MDILTFAFAGTTIELYKNLSVERSGIPGMDFELKNGCWGYLEEGFATNDILLGQQACDNQVKDPDKSGYKHSGSTLLHLDLNGDNILDVLIGDISFQNLVRVDLQKSSKGGDSAVSQERNFPSNTQVVDIPIFPGASYLELSGDGRKDLVAFPNNPNSIENHTGIWLYRNDGSATIPVFTLEKKGFLQDQMIDLGEGANPTILDLNNDGLKDIVIGSRGFSAGDGNYTTTLSYYQNIGTAANPSFKWITDDLGAISQLGLTNGLSPAFEDIDGDNNKDLLIGNTGGSIIWLKYNAANLNTFSLHQAQLKDNTGQVIDVGDFSHPSIVDLDADGKKDLIIGERGGNLNYYRNIGTPINPVFQRQSDTLGHVSAAAYLGDFGHSAPQFITENGNLILIMGTRSGKIKKYMCNASGNDFILLNPNLGGVFEGERCVPFMSDLNNDGLNDLLVGGHGGGLELFYQSDPNGISESSTKSLRLKAYPNPASNFLFIENLDYQATLIISDAMGRMVRQQALEGGLNRIDVSELPGGLYLFNLNSGSGILRTTVILDKP